MNDKGILLGVLCVYVIGIFCGAYIVNSHYQEKIAEYKLDKEKAEKVALNAKSKADSEALARIHEIERGYLVKLNNQKVEYEKTIDDLRSNFNPSGVFDCTGSGECMPRTNGSTTEFVCYKRTDLYRKIERSLAIGDEADKLAMKHKALVEVCNGR